jgi:chaperonin GroEL|tara:strand:+ start:421 stop:2061 length:1641 start_codon:yes stop_codon:yes gene_type:complete
MSKIIEFGPEGRNKLMKGINILADAVVSTLGPNGRNVVIEKEHGQVQSTKDGVTVAKYISVKDPVENLGVNLVREASIKTADKAGDGTTTSTLLAREMIKEGLKHLANGANAVEIKRSIDKAVKDVTNNLRKNISEDISSEEQLEQVATISANNDPEIGKLIATAMKKVGHEGVVHIEESKSGDTYLETVEGIQFERGYKSHFFVTNNNTMTSTLEDVQILIVDQKLTTVKDLLPLLENVASNNKSLLIIAEDIENEALATLIVNKGRGTIKVCAVKAPDFGDRRKLILEDIAIMTGGTVFSREKGHKWDKFEFDWFGEARTATIDKEKTTIIDGKGNEEAINNRINELSDQIDAAESDFEKEQLQNRLARIAGGVSIIHVGGYTEIEMNEKKDRVDDALHATKAAIEEGIVPGGGAALLYAREIIPATSGCNKNIGAEIVYKACGKPFEQILINAGHDSVGAQMLGKYQLVDSGNDTWAGYNIKKGTVVNMKKEGIIDPTKVTRVALENAAAVAGTVLLTECIVVNEPKDEKEQPQMDPSQMMGM